MQTGIEPKEVRRARVVVWHQGCLLVVGDARLSALDRYFSLPGGHIEQGETPASCAAREFEEEMGFAVALGRLWYIGDLSYQGRKRLIHEIVFYYQGFVDRSALQPGPVAPQEGKLVALLADPPTLAGLRCLPPRLFATVLADGPQGPPALRFVHE